MRRNGTFSNVSASLARTIGALLAVSAMMAPLSNAYSSDIALSDALSRLADAEKLWPKCAMRTETRTHREPNEKDFDAMVYVKDLRWDANRSDIAGISYKETRGKRYEQLAVRNLWNGKQYQFRQQAKARDSAQIWASVGTSAERKQRVRGFLASPFAGGFLSGMVLGDNDNIGAILKNSTTTISDTMETVGQNPCHVLESRPENGHYKVWIDPAHGFNIRKAVITREPGDIHFGSKLPKGLTIKGRQFVKRQIELDKIEIQNIEGRHIITSGTMVCTDFFTDGSKDCQYWEAERPNIQLDPDFEKLGAFVMDGIPEGTPVENEDFPGIAYMWNGREAIVDAGLEVIDQIDNIIAAEKTRPPFPTNLTPDANQPGQSPRPQPNTPPQEFPVAAPSPGRPALTWLLLGAAAAAAGVLALLLIRQRAAGRSRQNT